MYVGVHLTPDLHERFKRLAKVNERSISQELRRAIRRSLAEAEYRKLDEAA